MASTAHKYRLTTPPSDSLLCPVCLDVADDPWQHDKCGKVFCRECIEQHGKMKPCPHCREVQPQYFEDTKSKREINELPVKCNNVDRMCEWEGTVGALQEHETICEVALVSCPKKCGNCVLRKELEDHVKNDCQYREYQCEHCGKKGMYDNITRDHDKSCPHKIVSCANDDCTETTQRKSMKRHLEQCPFTVVPCKYIGLGCDVKKQRKEMATHENNDRQHFPIALKAVASLQTEKVTLQDKMARLENNAKLTATFKVVDYHEKLINNTDLVSQPFYTNPGGYCMTIKVKLCEEPDEDEDDPTDQDDYISVFVTVVTGSNDRQLTWPFRGAVTVTLLNQLENKNHYSRTIPVELRNADTQLTNVPQQGCRKFIPHSELSHNKVKNTQYLEDDTLYFRVSVEVDDHKPWLECTHGPVTETTHRSPPSFRGTLGGLSLTSSGL